MKLYEFDWGIYPRRVLVYLAEKGITDLDRVSVDLMRGENRQPAFLELNPAGTIPVLDARPEGVIPNPLEGSRTPGLPVRYPKAGTASGDAEVLALLATSR